MTEIFNHGADFTKLSESDTNLYVNKLIQKAYFGIDEIGTIGTKGGFLLKRELLILFQSLITLIFIGLNKEIIHQIIRPDEKKKFYFSVLE